MAVARIEGPISPSARVSDVDSGIGAEAMLQEGVLRSREAGHVLLLDRLDLDHRLRRCLILGSRGIDDFDTRDILGAEVLEDARILHPLAIQVEGRFATRPQHREGSTRSLHEGDAIQ